MESYRNLNINGFDLAPEPEQMEKVAATYRDMYREDLFSTGFESTGREGEGAQSSYTISNSVPNEVIAKSTTHRDGSTYYRCSAVDGGKDIEVKKQDWVHVEDEGSGQDYYRYTSRSGTTYITWTLDCKEKGKGREIESGSSKHGKKR